MLTKRIIAAASIAAVCTIGIVGCSSKELTLSSTCTDYMKLPPEQRHAAANQLGMANDWNGAGNPLYLTNLDYTCGQSPSITLRSAMGIK